MLFEIRELWSYLNEHQSFIEAIGQGKTKQAKNPSTEIVVYGNQLLRNCRHH